MQPRPLFNSTDIVRFAAVIYFFGFLAAVAHAAPRPLWLIGGNLLPCPEMSDAACSHHDANDMRQVALRGENIKAAVQPGLWAEGRTHIRILTQMLLRRSAERLGSAPVTASELWRRLGETYITRSGRDLSDAVRRQGLARYDNMDSPDPIVLKGGDFIDNQLSRLEKHLIIDHLQIAPAPLPTVSDTDLIRAFVQDVARESGREQPLILVITAARDNAFNAVAAASELLQQGGARAAWWPLDAALPEALEAQACNRLDEIRGQRLGRYQRGHLYPKQARLNARVCEQPQRLNTQLAEADGVLFVDGSLELLHASLFNEQSQAYDWTEMLVERFQNGQLSVAAAGVASQLAAGRHGKQSAPVIGASVLPRVNSAPMITELCAREPCASGFLNSGLGLFPHGLVDSHVAEFSREYRLLRIAAASHVDMGYGIDDGTVLKVRWLDDGHELQVQGQGAVIFIDTREAEYVKDDQGWAVNNAKLNRLVPGTAMRIRQDGAYRIWLPQEHDGEPRELMPPANPMAPFFIRAWTQWFAAGRMPYAEAEGHSGPHHILIRLQRPEEGVPIYISRNGLLGFYAMTIQLSLSSG